MTELTILGDPAGFIDFLRDQESINDIHLLRAQFEYSKSAEDVTKDERASAKLMNFMFLYSNSPLSVEFNNVVRDKLLVDYQQHT